MKDEGRTETQVATPDDASMGGAGKVTTGEAAWADSTVDVLPENYRACLDAIPDLLCLKGEDLQYAFVNTAYMDLLGKTRKEILGKRASDVFPKDVARRLETMDLLVLASGDRAIEELKIGDRIYEIRKFPVNLQEKGLVVVSGRDITSRKEAEAELLTEKIRFQIISDNAPLGMVLASGEGKLKYVNGRFRELFGYDLDEVPDGRSWFRKVFPGLEYTNEVASVLKPAGQTGGWERKEHRALTAVCKDGTRKISGFGAVQLTSGDIVISCADTVEGAADQNEALRAADYDTLTHLPNRSSMERAVGNAIERAREGKKRRSLSAFLLLEVCNLDSINEAYGALSGEGVLVALARLLKGALRLGDIAYRFERNRLVVVFMGISAAEARLAAERIQKTISQFTFTVESQSLPIDTAVGLIQIDGRDNTIALILHAADAVDRAKASGKNQMVVHEPAGG